MHRNLPRIATTLLMVLLLTTTLAWGREQLTVAVKQASVRTQPRIFAKKMSTLAYGDQVEVLSSRRAWHQVRLADGRSGWLQQSALTREDLQLSAGAHQTGTSASNEELTLAGKGFNSEVEKEYRQRNQRLDYTWVDRMETFSPSDRELQSFLRNGGLNAGGDDAR